MQSIFSAPATVGRYLEVEIALAEVEGTLGVIPAEASEALVATLVIDRIDLDRYNSDIELTGFPIVPLLDQLNELIPDEHGQYLHWGAATQDIMDTALVLQIREAFTHIGEQITSLRAVLANQAGQHRSAVMAGRSQLQYASPITFGLKVATWLSMFQRHAARLEQLEERLYTVQFGGAVGTLAALDTKGMAVQRALAERLDLGVSVSVWHVTRDSLAEAVSFLANLAASFGKIGQDVVLLAQSDVGEVRERTMPHRGVSSTMPQKHNPVSGQLLTVIATGVADCAGSMLRASIHDHERASGSWMQEWRIVPEAFILTAKGLDVAIDLVGGLEVDTDRMRANVETAEFIMAEAVMMELAQSLGRQRAHDAVAEAVQTASTTRTSFRSVLSSDPGIAEYISEGRIAYALQPKNYLGATYELIDKVLSGEERHTPKDATQ